MSTQPAQVERGAAVEASDGRLGTVDEAVVQPETGLLSYLVVRRGWTGEQLLIPADLIESVVSGREVRLRVTRDEASAPARTVPPGVMTAHAEGTELRIPLLEERLVAGKQPVDLGELRLHKHVEEIEETVRQMVTRDDVVVERIPLNRPLETPVEPRFEDGWLVMPVMKEVLVVEKRLMLVEEVRIGKRQVTEEQEVRERVRHERAELEDATVHGVRGLSGAGAAVASERDAGRRENPAGGTVASRPELRPISRPDASPPGD